MKEKQREKQDVYIKGSSTNKPAFEITLWLTNKNKFYQKKP